MSVVLLMANHVYIPLEISGKLCVLELIMTSAVLYSAVIPALWWRNGGLLLMAKSERMQKFNFKDKPSNFTFCKMATK